MTDFTKVDLDVLIPDMDAQRKRISMSYQGIADACDVSQSTIIRLFKRQSPPDIELLQKIAATIKYEPHSPVLFPTGYTVEAYIDYLQKAIVQQKGDYERQLLQQEALFNRMHRQNRRTILYLCIATALVACSFIVWLITH